MRVSKLVVGLTGAAVVAASVLSFGGVRISIEAAASEPSVHFTAAGDYSGSAEAASVLSTIGAIKPDLHLAVGDLSYSTAPSPEEGWCDFVKNRAGQGFPFEVVAGNHESNGESGSINNFAACLPNQLPGVVGTYGRQYYVDVPAGAPLVRFIMVSPALTFPDGVWSYAAGTARYNWTAAAIDNARTAGIPWVVVGMHKPCISMGAYTCDPGADFTSMLIEKKVDLVINGHEHIYQRSKQIALSAGCTSLVPGSYNAGCVADSDSLITKGGGTVFVTAGTGGTPARNVTLDDSESGYFATWAGLNANPTWGVLDVTATASTLDAHFSRAIGGTFTDAFTIGAGNGPANQPPVARFTLPCTLLSCAFDGSGSTDPDGTIASYAWNFGDTGTATGANASHTYAAAGTYPVTLTVVDDKGASNALTQSVTVTGPVSSDLARDDFNRTVASGWGTATLGGNWTITGTAAALQVAGGVGQITLAGGSTRAATLASVSVPGTDSQVRFTLDKVPTGGGMYETISGRTSGAANYTAAAWIKSTGQVALVIKQSAVVLSNTVVPGFTYAAGAELNLRVQVTASSPTTIRAKVWPTSQAEPAVWVTVTDSTAGLQGSGTVGIQSALSSSATSPIVTKFDDFVVRPPA